MIKKSKAKTETKVSNQDFINNLKNEKIKYNLQSNFDFCKDIFDFSKEGKQKTFANEYAFNCFGKIKYKNGDIYIGEIEKFKEINASNNQNKNNQVKELDFNRNGTGIFIETNGSKFYGSFVFNKNMGEG